MILPDYNRLNRKNKGTIFLTQNRRESNIHLSEEDGGIFVKGCSLLFLSFIFIFPLFLLTEEEELVKIDCSISPKRLSRGEEGKVILKLSLQEGITISPQPAFMIEFIPNKEMIFPKNFFTASDLQIEVLESKGDEYLNLKDPIVIPFTISLEAKQGSHILEGKVKYFASSKKEGWCFKSTSKFSASFFSRQSVVKKKK